MKTKSRIKTVDKMVLLSLALIIISLAYFLFNSDSFTAKDESGQGGSIGFITDIEIRDPEYARAHDIPGYIQVDLAEAKNMPKEIYVGLGSEISVTILLKFVSYREDLSEIRVNLDPNSGLGFSIEMPASPSGLICLNKLVTYDPSGTLTIKAGQTLSVKMRLKIPEDFQLPHAAFPLDPPGITTDDRIPMIYDMYVICYA